MEVSSAPDACGGQDVVVSLHWEDGDWESLGEIVRIECPYRRDLRSSVMGVRLQEALPHEHLTSHE